MTDHLAAARVDLDHLEACNHGSRLAYAIAHILDHLEAQQTDASIRRGLDDVAAGRTEHLGRFTDDEPEPEPDYGPRPDGCCGTCPPILGGGYDCTCADNPRCDANKADRSDRDDVRWVWCDHCDGFRLGHYRGEHRPGLGWTAAEIDERYGPLTFAHRPAEPPTAAPQPDEAHGDTPNPARPAETHTDNIRAEAWDEGYQAGLTEMYHDNPYRKARA